MKRASSIELSRWVESDGRKPLIVRGARQVGKTWLVRDLARASGLELIEINFEQDPLAARWFASNDPRQILGELSLAVGRDVVPGKSLLFLDEIQAGYGRTGTILAAHLIVQGEKAMDAIAEVRRLRPGAVETREQEFALFEFEADVKRRGM